MAVISVEHLAKHYGATTAVADVSFEVARGELVGLLGRNGAGKTTTIEILEGYRRPSSGAVRVLGLDPARGGRRLRNRVGIVLQSAGIDGTLTVRESVALYAGFYRPRRPVAEILAEVGLLECAGQRVATLSGGQRRRVDLALALTGSPEVLFLDEPTTGLDPAARRQTWEVVSELRRRGVAILLTSHYLDEVEHLADRVVVLHLGRVVAEGAPEEIRDSSPRRTLVTLRLPAGTELPTGPFELAGLEHGTTSLLTSEVTATLRLLAEWAVGRGLELDELEVRRPSLEDAYLDLTEGR